MGILFLVMILAALGFYVFSGGIIPAAPPVNSTPIPP
jgi:hypothetical protein